MAVSQNTYIKGLNRDISKSKFSNTSYYYLLNGKVITEEELTTGSITNEKGNELMFKVPSLGKVYKLSIASNNKVSFAIWIDSSSSYLSIISNPNIKDLYRKLKNAQSISSGEFEVANIGNEYILVIQLDVTKDPFFTNIASPNGVKIEEYIPAIENPMIIGWGNLRDYIVLFTTDGQGKEPNGTSGQIWLLKYDSINRTIENLDSNNYLVPSKHLIYNNKLDFSTYNRVGEVIGRYENSQIARVYWTDNYNPVRSLNIFDYNFDKKPEDIQISSTVNMTAPSIESIGSGSIPAGSIVQYCYRLFDSNGRSTVFSPLTPPLQLTASDPNSGYYQDYQGTKHGSGDYHSVRYNCFNVDTDYDTIEHIVVIYESSKNSPKAYKFREEPITGPNISVLHTGEETYIPISLTELSRLSDTSGLIAKTITQRSNRLLLGNIRKKRFDVDFDARAYRFRNLNGDIKAILYDKDGNIEYILTPNNFKTTKIKEDADLINPYNDTSDLNYEDPQKRYIYQSDGKTIGGEGPNVKYKIITKVLEGDVKIKEKEAPFIEVTREPSGGAYIDLGDMGTVPSNDQFRNFKSPIYSAYLRGYARGEVYRFGIVFYDKFGNPSFTKWIGDIRFPEEYHDIGSNNQYWINDNEVTNDSRLQLSTFSIGGTGKDRFYANNEVLQSLGIEFTIDVSSIKDQISAFEIVRVERTENDRSRLGTGILMPVIKPYWKYDKGNNHTSETIFDSALDNHKEFGGTMEVNGDNRKNVAFLSDRTFYGSANFSSGQEYKNPAAPGILTFLSPLTQFKEYTSFSFKDGDYIKVTGGYYTYNLKTDWHYGYYGPVIYHNYQDNERQLGFYYRLRQYSKDHIWDNYHELYKIEKLYNLERAQYINDLVIPSWATVNFGNVSYAAQVHKGGYTPIGIGERKALLILKNESGFTTIGYPKYKEVTIYNYYSPGVFQWAGTNTPDTEKNTWLFKNAVYCRPITAQYGGNDYESRQKNRYISTGIFQRIRSGKTVYTNKVWGGDVYVSYYDDNYIYANWSTYEEKKNEADPYVWSENEKYRFTLAIFYPTEVPFNVELRQGIHFAKDQGSTQFSNRSYNDFIYETLYDQENNVKKWYIPKDPLLKDITEFPHRIMVSNKKYDGELLDSWKVFPTNQFNDVDGIYGPINKLITFKTNTYFYQERAFGMIPIDERATSVDDTGINIILGEGDVISKPYYISTKTGTMHQFSVVASGGSIYHFDAKLKKIFRYAANGVNPLTDIKGLSGYFKKNIDGNIISIDRTTKDILQKLSDSVGVSAVFDNKNNRVLFTFLNYDLDEKISKKPLYDRAGNIVGYIDVVKYDFIDKRFTISYNEVIDAFESFHSYTPRLYLNHDGEVLSTDENNTSVYIHGEGEYGKYYDKYYDTVLHLVLNKDPELTKIYDILQYNSESYNSSGYEDWSDTFNTIRLYNDYQDSGTVNLVNNGNLIRRFRSWRIHLPRDKKTDMPRIRGKYAIVELTYNNKDNKRFILHDILLFYRVRNFVRG